MVGEQTLIHLAVTRSQAAQIAAALHLANELTGQTSILVLIRTLMHDSDLDKALAAFGGLLAAPDGSFKDVMNMGPDRYSEVAAASMTELQALTKVLLEKVVETKDK